MTAPSDNAPRGAATDAANAADAIRFRRRLYWLGAIALAGLAALTARLVWLQALQ